MRKRFVPILLLLVVLALAACTQAPAAPDQQATIEAAVQATLAANTPETAPTTTPIPQAETPQATDTPAPGPTQAAANTPTPQPETAQRVILPPSVKDFNPELRPASTIGDLQAPVVMYEWSDYT